MNLSSRCGNILERSLSVQTSTNFSSVYSHMVAYTTLSYHAPFPIYVLFSEPVNFTVAALSITGGSVLGVTHLTAAPSFTSEEWASELLDVYLFYVRPSSSQITNVTVVLPFHALRGVSGRYNMQSNKVALSFVPDGASCLSSPFTNRNPYEVIVQYPYAITGVVVASSIIVEGCKVIDISIVQKNRLRIVLEIFAEGKGHMTIPSGLSLSMNGVVSEQFEWDFEYGKRRSVGMMGRCDASGSEDLVRVGRGGSERREVLDRAEQRRGGNERRLHRNERQRHRSARLGVFFRRSSPSRAFRPPTTSSR